MTEPSDIVGVAVDYPQLRALLAARRRELGLRQLEVDDLAGLQGGYTGKLECGDRHLGDMSMGSLLGALGVGLQVVLAASKQESLSDLAKASVKRRIDARKKLASLGGSARAAKLSPDERRKIARQGGLTRAMKARLRKKDRSPKTKTPPAAD